MMDFSRIFKPEFAEWLSQFATAKGNQLQYSNSNMPKRTEIITIDLSTVRDESSPYEVKVPFTSVHVESIYTTATGVAATGSVKISYDYGDIASIRNAKTMNANDAFSVDSEIAKCFLTWSAQPGISARLAFMTDIDFRPGATQSTITSGNVAITSNKHPVPSSIVTRTCAGAAGTATYTIPANFYAIVRAAVVAQNANGSAGVSANTVPFCLAYSQASNTASSSAYAVLPAGTVVDLNSGAAAGGVANAVIELYPV